MPEGLRGQPVAPLVDLRETPVRVVVREPAERRKRLHLAEHGEPRAQPRAGPPLPCFQRRQHVEIPQGGRVDQEVEERLETEVGEAHQAAEACHLPGSGVGGVERRPQVPQPRGFGRKALDMREERGVLLEDPFSRERAREGVVDARLVACHQGERRDQRIDPQGPVGQPPGMGAGKRDRGRRDQPCGPGQPARGQEPGRRLGPGEECLEFVRLRLDEEAERGQAFAECRLRG